MTNQANNPPGAVSVAWSLAEQAKSSSKKMSGLRIAIAAVVIADEKGIDAVTIRAVAEKVGLTPMGVYRHFASREDILLSMLELALDTPPKIAPSLPWQDAFRAWSKSLLDRYEAHPWSIEVPSGIPATPNHIAWVEQALDILAPTQLPLQRQLDCALLVSGHTQQFARIATTSSQPATNKDELNGILSRIENQAPHLVNAIRGGALQSKDGPDFMAGIDIIIHGIEQEAKN